MKFLIMNKVDRFAEKIARTPLSDYLPEYQGGSDAEAAMQYMLDQLTSRNTRGSPIYAFFVFY